MEISKNKIQAFCLKIEPSRVKIEPNSLKIHPFCLKIEPRRVKIEPKSVKIHPFCLKIEPIRVKIHLLNMKFEFTNFNTFMFFAFSFSQQETIHCSKSI